MRNKFYCFACFPVAVFLISITASAEMGMHWWPCATVNLPRAYTKLLVFDDFLWSISGKGVRCGDDAESGLIICWPVQDHRVLNFRNCLEYEVVSRLPSDIGVGVAPDYFVVIVHDGKMLVFYSGRVNRGLRDVFISSDGILWDHIAIPAASSGPPPYASFNGLIWSHGCEGGLPVLRNSQDGLEWSNIEPIGDLPCCSEALVEFQGRLVSLGSNSNCTRESPDGITWFAVPQGEYGYEDLGIASAVVANDHIWLFAGLRQPSGSISGRLVYKSSDAQNWQLVTDRLPFFIFTTPGSPGFQYSYAAWGDRIYVFRAIELDLEHPISTLFFTQETPSNIHSADYDGDGAVSLSELLRGIQLYQAGRYRCDGTTEDTYAPGAGWETCVPHNSDYNPQDWRISLGEILRLIQLYNSGGYHPCPEEGTEDGFCPGAG